MAFLAQPTSVVQKFSPHIGKEHFCLFPLKTYRSVFLLLISEIFRQEASFNTSGSGMMEKDDSCRKKKTPHSSCAFITESCSSRPGSLNINSVTEKASHRHRGMSIWVGEKQLVAILRFPGISPITCHCPEI